MMLYITVGLLFLLCIVGSTDTNDKNQPTYTVSPAIPPTAFVGDFYTLQLRVIGMDQPRFDFDNIPSWFSSHPNGTIQGTPLTKGSFPVKVSFQSGNINSSQEIIIRVMDSNSVSPMSVVGGNSLIVMSPMASLTCVVGSFVSFLFQAQNGKLPYIWTYTNLPAGLRADMRGTVNGTLFQEGYYTFSAIVSDSSGSTADSYLTVNVQPKSASNGALVEVPSRNIPMQFNLTAIEQQALAATRAVFNAINIVYSLQNETNEMRDEVAKTVKALAMAEEQEQQSKAMLDRANQAKNIANQLSIRAGDALKIANNTLELAATNQANVGRMASTAISGASKAYFNFRQAEKNLTSATQTFIKAQNESLATAFTLKQALLQNIDAYGVYNSTFQTFKDAKNILQQQLDIKLKADMIVDAASNSRNIAGSVNDYAQAELSKTHNAYTRAVSALNNTLAIALGLAANIKDAQNNLGVAKFNLQQAINNLLVAQTRKEQADKATAIVTMQSSTLPDPSQRQAYTFGGCEPQAYPMMAGTAQVRQVNRFGYQLSSGQVVVFGNCTQISQVFRIGDLISFVGYLKDGLVQAQSIAAV